MTDLCADEQQFYSRYSWCLNPILSIDDLLQRFREELEGYPILSGWQREESKGNLYLFACAIACTADDYLALRWFNLKPFGNRLPKLRTVFSTIQSVGDSVQSTLKVRDIAARQWRRKWDECVAAACKLVIADSNGEDEAFRELCRIAGDLSVPALPEGLVRRRMRLPEAFRSQDMAHHDVITLIERFCACKEAADAAASGAVIMGLRTAGAYFAPLMAEYLKQKRFPDVSWFSIRPKNGITRWEAQCLRNAAREKKQLLIVDDYPSTGHTFRLTFEIVRSFGVEPEQMNVLAPTHPAQTRWAELAGIQKPVRVFTFPTTELYKVRSLAASDVERLCCEYYGNECKPRVTEDPDVDGINQRLAQHSKDGHHVREKRVFTLEFQDGSGRTTAKKLLFKSAGWGWLGYHAYLAGTRLEGFVPKVIGLRNGLISMEWIDRAHQPAVVLDESAIRHMARYVAARSRRLPLAGDCRWESRTYRWTGCDDILNILRGAYGPYVNRLKVPALRNQLQRVVTSVPTLIDGRMKSEEWLQTSGGLYKADFEHHNFGGGELDIVDPAYDLAAAIHEFRLSREAEQQLLQTYIEESGDAGVHERILLHKLLYGTIAMKYATNALASGRDPEKNNERRQHARNFLVYSMNEFCAQFIARAPASATWSPRLFFMDLDGVFDHELLGFPHATLCGLKSIALLRSHGFSVIPNTGRSIQHVRQYCGAYGFPGGIAEFGSVFLDAVDGHEVPLVDPDALEQLEACRNAIRDIPGVFTDPGYEYSIRAYRYNGGGTVGLKKDEIKSLLSRAEFSKLACVFRSADTHIVQKRTNKGAALRTVRRLVGSPSVPVTAIGDSQHDIAMLAAAEFAYAPANCSPLIRQLAKEGKSRIMKQRFQNGLLAAVKDRIRKESKAAGVDSATAAVIEGGQRGLIGNLLKAADRRPLPQALLALLWWNT